MLASDASKAKPAVAQAPWQVPTRVSPEPVLKVYNSLTRTKVRFEELSGAVGRDGELMRRCGGRSTLSQSSPGS